MGHNYEEQNNFENDGFDTKGKERVSEERVDAVREDFDALKAKLTQEFEDRHNDTLGAHGREGSETQMLRQAFNAFDTVVGFMMVGDMKAVESYKNSPKFARLGEDSQREVIAIIDKALGGTA